jgi:hypothetical protein
MSSPRWPAFASWAPCDGHSNEDPARDSTCAPRSGRSSFQRCCRGRYATESDGVVTGIFHVVDAFELITTGLRREAREAEQATRTRSAVLALGQAGVPDVPAATRLVGLNTRRNTSVHGEWLEVLDPDALLDAIKAGRQLLAAVERYAKERGIAL